MKRILAINPPVLCVNDCQRSWYSFAHPTSLLKIAAYHLSLGHSFELLDCMEYEEDWDKPLTPYKPMPIGTDNLGLRINTYVLGRPIEWLTAELEKRERPDEVLVSCHITFNAELAHAAIAAVSRVFPGVPIHFGGNYPTLFPAEAAKTGASVFTGRLPDATTLFPEYSVMKSRPRYCVFQLTLGCANKCSHCVNPMLGPIVKFDIPALVADIALKRKQYGVRTFVNIDPNTACFDLRLFLETMIEEKVDVDLYFFGGIQPNYVTDELVSLMKRAHVKGMTLPRELDVRLNAKLGKKYVADDFFRAIRCFEAQKYDLSMFHCSFPVGFRDEDLNEVRKTIEEIRGFGAIPEISPVAFVPGTGEYKRHADLLQSKTLEELNWALWPSIDSAERIRAYAEVYNFAHSHQFVRPWSFEC